MWPQDAGDRAPRMPEPPPLVCADGMFPPCPFHAAEALPFATKRPLAVR